MGLDGVEIVLEVEDAFSISVPDDEGGEVRTVSNLVDLVIRRLRDSDDPPVIDDAALRPMILENIRGIIVDQMAIDPERVTPEANLVEDLGID